MKQLCISFATVGLLSLSASYSQAQCQVETHREACPGAKDALKPYGGQDPTTDTLDPKDAESCKKLAEKKGKIVRRGTLSKKVSKIKFDGKEIGTFTDEQPCK